MQIGRSKISAARFGRIPPPAPSRPGMAFAHLFDMEALAARGRGHRVPRIKTPWPPGYDRAGALRRPGIPPVHGGESPPVGESNVEDKTSWFVSVDLEALAISSPMHLLGRDMRMSVPYPNGRSIELIHIPNLDHAWQNTGDFEGLRNLRKQLFWQPR